MTRADIDFLKDLQHELLTQENDGNADPLYWGIMERKEVRVPDGEGSVTYFIMDDDSYTLDEFVQKIDEIFEDNPDFFCDYEDAKAEWTTIRNNYTFESVNEFAYENFTTEFYTVDMEERDVLCQNTGAFLTKRAAKEYIQKYSYNHCKPRTWAMTAFRNFELEHLLKILKSADFDQFKIDEE